MKINLFAFFAGSLLFTTSASAQSCPADRTPLEMAGHILCLLNTAPPRIHQNENGEVTMLVWPNLEQLKNPPFPDGIFYLTVQRRAFFNIPPIEETQPSRLSGTRENLDSPELSPRPDFLYLQGARIDGQPFGLRCQPSLNPIGNSLGAQSCTIYAVLHDDMRINAHFETISLWGDGPAWPPLDENWAETWPPYLAQLETALNNLFFIQ
jgi:hypothetical protein